MSNANEWEQNVAFAGLSCKISSQTKNAKPKNKTFNLSKEKEGTYLTKCWEKDHFSLNSAHTNRSLDLSNPTQSSHFPLYLPFVSCLSLFLSSFMLCTPPRCCWVPRHLRSLLIVLVTQVYVWSSTSNCSSLAWREEGCGHLASRSALKQQD